MKSEEKLTEYERIAKIMAMDWRDWFARYNPPQKSVDADISRSELYAEAAWNDARHTYKFPNDHYADFRDVFISTFYS